MFIDILPKDVANREVETRLVANGRNSNTDVLPKSTRGGAVIDRHSLKAL
jgi:hypothetical protein